MKRRVPAAAVVLAIALIPEIGRAEPGGCPFGPAKPTGSVRKLALLVGVGRHDTRLPALGGARRDVDAMFRLLADPRGGYGFPRENICVLKDENATTEAFRRSFKKALIDRAKSGDTVVVYISAIGSQVEDEDDDELDGLDESLVLFDSRKEAKGGYVEDLTDDELNGLVRDLYAKAEKLDTAVLIDASVSWTLSALEPRSGLKFITPRDPTLRGPKPERREPDEDESGMISPHAGLVVAIAGAKGLQAVEGPDDDPGGVFTSALVRAASRPATPALTYKELALAIAPIAGARSRQLASWSGQLETKIFGAEDHPLPLAAKITSIKKNKIELADADLPGIAAGAVMRVRSPELAGVRDPLKVVATIRINSVTGDRATATVQEEAPDRKISPGDMATLVSPGGDWSRLLLYIRPDAEYGGFNAKKKKELMTELSRFHPSLSARMSFTSDRRYAYELALTTDGRMQLFGPGSDVRATFAGDDATEEVGAALVGLLRQELFLELEPEPSAQLVENAALELSTREPISKNGIKQGDAPWPAQTWNGTQSVPACRSFQLLRRAKNGACGAGELELGGLVLSSNGEMRALPKARVSPRDGEARWGAPVSISVPIDSTSFVLGFASCATTELPWDEIANAASYDFEPRSELAAELASRLEMGAPAINHAPWTWTIVPLRAVTPEASRVAEASVVERREFSIPRFDINPYLPEDQNAPLGRVLKLAHQLAFACVGKTCDGYDYEQKNPWKGSGCEDSDRDLENLKHGIDCSRAIWYVFTRAGLNYAKKTKNAPSCYLNTKVMTGTTSPMREAFADCMRDPLKRTGDVLVYRHPKEDKGHVVLLIDAERRIVWGSHGFGGSNAGDRGVEYQLVGLRRAFKQFDASERIVGCWRHRAFIDKTGAMATPPRGTCFDEPCANDGFAPLGGLPK